MILKILGVLDILIAVTFWVYGIFHFEFLSATILFFGIVLLIKGFVFIANFNVASILDVLSGTVLLLTTNFTIPKIIVIIISLYLIQKGVFSLLS